MNSPLRYKRIGKRLALTRLWSFLFPPSRWNRCQPMTEHERLAHWELRAGEHRTQERMREWRNFWTNTPA